MQNIRFHSMNDFWDYLPENELKMAEALRYLVLDTIPHIKEGLSYSIPLYKQHLAICFIWPACITWGGKTQVDGVRFGFNKGYLLNDASSYLDKGTRKQIYCKDFTTINEIDFNLLRSYLYEAAFIDEQQYLAKRKK